MMSLSPLLTGVKYLMLFNFHPPNQVLNFHINMQQIQNDFW
jgi:hypothetical protein